jgi:hypothetical protein
VSVARSDSRGDEVLAVHDNSTTTARGLDIVSTNEHLPAMARCGLMLDDIAIETRICRRAQHAL